MADYSWRVVGVSPSSSNSKHPPQRFVPKHTRSTTQIANIANQNIQLPRNNFRPFLESYMQDVTSKRSMNSMISQRLSSSPSLNKGLKINKNENEKIVYDEGIQKNLKDQKSFQIRSFNGNNLQITPKIKIISPQRQKTTSPNFKLKNLNKKIKITLESQISKIYKIKQEIKTNKQQISQDLMSFLIQLRKTSKQASDKFNQLSTKYNKQEKNQPSKIPSNNPQRSINSEISIQLSSPQKSFPDGLLTVREVILQKFYKFETNINNLQSKKDQIILNIKNNEKQLYF